MANKFWVPQNGTLTWAVTGPTNWGSASGVADNQTVPGAGDIAIFDGGSGVGNSIISASTGITGLSCDGALGTGTYGGTLTHNTAVTLTLDSAIAGNANAFMLTAGMTYTPASTTSLVTFANTSGTAIIKCAGKSLFAMTMNGVGGTVRMADDLMVNAGANSILTLTNGTIDANTNTAAITACKVDISVNNTRTLSLGGTVTLGGNITAATNMWNVLNTGTLTFNKNSANLIVLAPASSITQISWSGGNLTYNDLTLNTLSNSTILVFGDSNTFAHLNINPGWQIEFGSGKTQTIQNAFTWTGTQANPIALMTVGSADILSVASGTCTLTWGLLSGITGSGGATFTATNVLNGGNNSGWAISPPADATTTVPTGAIKSIAVGTVDSASTTTSVTTSALSFNNVAATGVVADQFKNKAILFAGNTTTAGLRGAAATISANTASNTPTFTVGTLPATPASGDSFTVS